MPTQVARKRFLPNVPVRAGTLYKIVINGKDYIVKAKYNKTLSEFNAMWFDNVAPKQYFFNRAQFNSFSGGLMPSDEIVVDGVKYKNEQVGLVDNNQLNVIFSEYKEARLDAGLLLTGNEYNSVHRIKIRPFRNSNAEELKYFNIDNFGRTAWVSVYRVNKPQIVEFEVIETFTPARASASNSHSATINFTGFTVSYQGTSPSSTTATTATYTIPNSLVTRKLTVTPNGASALILKFE